MKLYFVLNITTRIQNYPKIEKLDKSHFCNELFNWQAARDNLENNKIQDQLIYLSRKLNY